MMKKFIQNKRYIYVFIGVFFLWGVALRAVEVVSGNYLFGFDVGRDLLVAKNIIDTHKFTLIGAQIGSGSAGIEGIFQGPGYYYLLAIGYVLFRGDPYGALVMMFLFGVVTLAASYWTVCRIFDRPTAIVTLFLVGISPLIVSQSRFVWAPHPASLLIVLTLYFAYLIPKRPRVYSALAILSAGLTYHFEFAMTVPMVIALFLALPVVFRIKDVRTYLYSFAAVVAAFAPLAAFEMRHGFMALSSIFSYTTPQGPVGGDVWWLRIQDHSFPYLESAKNSFAIEHGFIQNPVYALLVAGLVFGLIFFGWKAKQSLHRVFFRFILLLTITTYVTLLFLNNLIWDYYLIHLHFVYIYVFAYICIYTFRLRKFLYAKVILAILAIFLLSMTVSSAWRMMIDYTYDFHDFGGVEKIRGKRAAIDYVYKDAKGKPFSEFTFMPPIYTYPYDYLFQTYGKQTYGYIPESKKKGLVYLIIEPDASKPWTYKGWLETVIVDGDIIQTVTLPSGQIVQKRQFPL